MRNLKVRWDRKDGKPWDEWTLPSSVDSSKLNFKELDDTLQIFLGNRVFGNISKDYLLKMMRNGEGYEYIEEWKMQHHISLSQLSGKQILTLTNMLREYGHHNQ